MSKVSRAAACIAVVAELLLTGIGAGLPTNSAAAADNCAGSPGAAAPTGQHWYYRVDAVNHRRCWYRHAIVPLAARAGSQSRAAPSELAPSAATSRSPSAATPQTTNAESDADETASAQTEPHLKMLSVKPVTPPAIDTTPVAEADMAEHMGGPQTANVTPDEGAKPARTAGAATMRPKSDVAHDASRDALAPARREVAPTTPTQSARLLFSLLALALGIAAALVALLGKITSVKRAPRPSEHPDDAWRRYRTSDHQTDEPIMHPGNAPLLAPGEPYQAVDLDVPESLDQSSPAKADFPPAPRHGKPWPSERADLTQKDIELRLRILRHPRRGVVRSKTEH
jgi:hypothetical protein